MQPTFHCHEQVVSALSSTPFSGQAPGQREGTLPLRDLPAGTSLQLLTKAARVLVAQQTCRKAFLPASVCATTLAAQPLVSVVHRGSPGYAG